MAALFSSTEAQAWTGAAAIGALPTGFSGVSTDSRSVSPGQLFVALRGARFDGHAFLAAAASAGAAAAVVDVHRHPPPPGLPLLEVADTLVALGALARGLRRTLQPQVLGVTGSVGKTSTKELLAAALAPLGPVLKTEGNLNNEIGLPLTLLGLRAFHRAVVLEMGMNHRGEIARLTAIAEPRIGLVLNVREVHLETLGTIENVALAKAELFHGLPLDGTAIANADDPRVLAGARAAARRTLTFGREDSPHGPPDVGLISWAERGFDGVQLSLRADGQAHDLQLRLLGAPNALNACAAVAAALAAGVAPGAAVAGLAAVRSAPHRLEVRQLPGEITLLDDCYNASPTSMRAALATLAAGSGGRRRGAILGDMLELGPAELDLHRLVGQACAGLSWLVCVGTRAEALAEGARAVGVAATTAQGLEEGLLQVRAELRSGDAVLLKASRGMRLERFAEALGAGPSGGH